MGGTQDREDMVGVAGGTLNRNFALSLAILSRTYLALDTAFSPFLLPLPSLGSSLVEPVEGSSSNKPEPAPRVGFTLAWRHSLRDSTGARVIHGEDHLEKKWRYDPASQDASSSSSCQKGIGCGAHSFSVGLP